MLTSLFGRGTPSDRRACLSERPEKAGRKRNLQQLYGTTKPPSRTAWAFARLILVPKPTYTRTQRLTLFLVPRLASAFIRVLGSTLRYEDMVAPGVVPGSRIAGPVVYAFWHRCLLSCAYYFRDQEIAILISRSFDGELIARTVERLGFIAIRGSSSRGGATALRQMAEEYSRGARCAITADGPRGPNMIAKPGTAQLAQLIGAWVGAFYVLPLHAWELDTWDRFLIPKPFSRVIIAWPPHVPAGEVTESSVQQNLEDAVAMAARHVRWADYDVSPDERRETRDESREK